MVIYKNIHLGLRRFFWLQTGLTMLLVIAACAFMDIKSAYSALLGGAICTFTSWCFAHQAFKFRGAQQSNRIVKSFYVAEGTKWCLTFLLFTLVFIFVPVSAPMFFISYIMVQALFWLAPQVVTSKLTSSC